jgi:hypothetical protein
VVLRRPAAPVERPAVAVAQRVARGASRNRSAVTMGEELCKFSYSRLQLPQVLHRGCQINFRQQNFASRKCGDFHICNSSRRYNEVMNGRPSMNRPALFGSD